MIELAHDGDPALVGGAHHSLHAKIGCEGPVVERIDFVAGGRVECQTEALGLDPLENCHHLTPRQFPRFPPESGVRSNRTHGIIEHIEESRQSFADRNAAAARTWAIFAT